MVRSARRTILQNEGEGVLLDSVETGIPEPGNIPHLLPLILGSTEQTSEHSLNFVI